MRSILRDVIGKLGSDLKENKKILREAVESSTIREKNKKEMISIIEGISNKDKLLFYVYNSLLKYEGDEVYKIKV